MTHRHLPILSDAQREGLNPSLLEPVEYRKSGLSLNHIVGCPLDCGYCVRHIFDNFGMKTPRALMSDEDAVQLLVNHRYFQPHVTPIQVFNRATDPFLPVVKPYTFRVLEHLDALGLRNHVLVITRWHITSQDCERLNQLANLRVTVLVTHSGIDHPGIEPVDSQIAARSLRVAFEHAERYRVVLYWRPLVPGLNDTDAHIARARELSRFAHAVVSPGCSTARRSRRTTASSACPSPTRTPPAARCSPKSWSAASSKPSDSRDRTGYGRTMRGRRCFARPPAGSPTPTGWRTTTATTASGNCATSAPPDSSIAARWRSVGPPRPSSGRWPQRSARPQFR